MMNLAKELKSRGMVHQLTDSDLDNRLEQLKARFPIASYAGFDPTSNSLHVGNFIAILGLMYAQRHGLRPIALVGGATGMIGDPSGKAAERQIMSKQQVLENAQGIQRVLERFLDFEHPTAPAMIVNNLDWFGSMSAIDYLRDIGKHFRLGSMLAKDSVRARMESTAEGMSYTEFSYQVLQAYDFYHLYKKHNCVLQIGGSDQWGNITAGTDLIRKLEGESGNAYGLVMPLVTTTSGAKFGKTEGNAVWLSEDRTSVFEFYQFWLRTEDADVGRYLRYFTFLALEQIDAIEKEHKTAPEKRAAQRRLADEVTMMVHGAGAAAKARDSSQVIYGGGTGTEFSDETIEALSRDVPTSTIMRSKIEAGWPLIDAVVETGLAKSKSDARRLISQGGIYVNNQQTLDVSTVLTPGHLATKSSLVLRSGKKTYRLVRIA